MSRFFTADPHFGHTNVIQHAKRPFKDTRQMNSTIIKNYNSMAGADDDLYVIGDFSLLSAKHRTAYESWLGDIKARVHLICGNHDVLNRIMFLAGDTGVGFKSIHYPYLRVGEYICVHDPSAAIVVPDKIVLSGHVHQMWKHCNNAINVGVDVWDYMPVSELQILEYIYSQDDLRKYITPYISRFFPHPEQSAENADN